MCESIPTVFITHTRMHINRIKETPIGYHYNNKLGPLAPPLVRQVVRPFPKIEYLKIFLLHSLNWTTRKL